MRRLSTFPFIFLGMVVSLSGYSQRQKISLTCDTINFNKKSFEDSLKYYKEYFGKNHDVSKVDDQLALAYYVALRHYPELTKAKIKIRKKESTRFVRCFTAVVEFSLTENPRGPPFPPVSVPQNSPETLPLLHQRQKALRQHA